MVHVPCNSNFCQKLEIPSICSRVTNFGGISKPPYEATELENKFFEQSETNIPSVHLYV